MKRTFLRPSPEQPEEIVGRVGFGSWRPCAFPVPTFFSLL